MNSAKSLSRPTPDDDDLDQASVRELIVQLALAEDERRNTSNPARIAALNRREQAIMAALHGSELGPAGHGSSNHLGQPTACRPLDGGLVK